MNIIPIAVVVAVTFVAVVIIVRCFYFVFKSLSILRKALLVRFERWCEIRPKDNERV